MTFELQHDGHLYLVHTEVGDGPARVLLDETPRMQCAPSESLETSGDDE
ncbi:MAG TPA: hypothetical protein VGE22_12490 [Solimonas sp.]